MKAKKEARKMWETPGRQAGKQGGKENSSQGAGNERLIRGAGNTGG